MLRVRAESVRGKSDRRIRNVTVTEHHRYCDELYNCNLCTCVRDLSNNIYIIQCYFPDQTRVQKILGRTDRQADKRQLMSAVAAAGRAFVIVLFVLFLFRPSFSFTLML